MMRSGRIFCAGLFVLLISWTFSFDSAEAATVVAPASITVPAMDADGTYSVRWGASTTPGATYQLQEATDSGFTAGLRTINAGALTTAIKNRTLGKVYYYRVRATKTGYTASAWRTGGKGCKISVNPLVGRWIWQSDSDGSSPAAGAECSLVFFDNGSADFNCFMPSQEYHDDGKYSVAGATTSSAKLTLTLADYGVYLTSAPVKVVSGKLVLPFMVINVDPGTSTWKKQPDPPIDTTDFVAVAFKVYEDSLMSGLSDDDAAIAAANALKAGAFAASSQVPSTPADNVDEVSSQSATAAVPLTEVILNAKRTAIKVKNENGMVYWVLLRPKAPPSADEYAGQPAVNPLSPGYFAGDPRTHLYMTQSSGPNDPAQYAAKLLFPMNSQVVYRKGRYYAFNTQGEDPEAIRAQLLRAGYSTGNILVRTDAQVTPKTIADQLLKNPGVFYISTHGVYMGATETEPEEFLMVTGAKVTVAPGQTRDDAIVAAVVALGLPAYLQNTIIPVPLEVGRLKEETFLGVGSAFFDALRANNPGWDMSKSLVYLDACSSTGRANGAVTPLTRTLFNNPAVLIGWKEPSDPFVGVRYSQHFFQNSARKTHSAREVWDETWRVLMTRNSIYEEDALLDDAINRRALVAENTKFEAFGSNGQPYLHLGDKLYTNTLPDIVFWLVWLGRWNQIPGTASNNLQSCYDQFWKNQTCGGLASSYCNSGCVGGHKPTANEVKEARQLINGQPTPIARGRWTLADKIPYGQ
jgi:hypothetical protein